MSFYLRKSIRVGPLRFNLSKSGIGVSAGIKGFRVGSGPRGNYVHMGRGGIYYRKTFSNGERNSYTQTSNKSPREQYLTPQHTTHPDVVMHEIESSDVSRMTHSSSAELLQELTAKQKKLRLTPICFSFTLLAPLILLITNQPQVLIWITAIAFLALTIYAHLRDELVKTTVLLYDIDSNMESGYARLHENALQLASCSGCWHISAAGAVHDTKYHAGASTLLNRKPTSISKSSPPFLKTNIDTIGVDVGRQTLYFFPDRILVYDEGRVGAIGYDQLQVHVSQTKFIESEGVPRDAKVVDRTWRFVNKNGGPDRRFSNNRELPICLYDEIHLSSSTGLNEILQVSRSNIGGGFAGAVRYLAQQLNAASSASNQLYRIGKNGEDLGDIPLSTVVSMMREGTLSSNDYYFDIQTSNWEHLHKLIQ